MVSRLLPLCLTGTLAGALSLLPRDARAEDGELPVAVLTVQTLDAFEQADALTNALKRSIEDAPGWSTAQLPKDYALLVLSNSLGCTDPPDAACEEKIAAEIKVDRFVWGQMKKEGRDVAGDLHFWVRGQGSKVTQFRYSANLTTAADETLVEVARGKFIEMAGGPPGGKVKLSAGKVSGDITVDGKPAGKLVAGVATLDLPVGTHKIRVTAPGYEDMEASIEIKPRDDRAVTLVPVKAADGPDLLKIFGFTALGVGVVAGGVATYAGVRVLQINSDLEPFRSGVDGDWVFAQDKDGCEAEGNYPNIVLAPGQNNANDEKRAAIQDSCSQGRTFETMTLGLWPVAGAFAGAGIIMIATADWSGSGSETAALPFTLIPSFGPEGAQLGVAGRF
jgi:hypothetical protein